ncbi:peroxiredoxin, Ohr subfamily [Exidia glandulosa HHB12029]|uniref:Peroxiredoxin, Ohr subfamily n=1 Tax=Exidia glandulosa HHB12029 TaxID=1314781 RepID=A0A165KYQ4_EXIGL|nr:peroxiredoxin, Ohr subfamily [Exidia glandulosa HHB12029]
MSFLNAARRTILASSRTVQRRGLITLEKPIYTTTAVALGGGRQGTTHLEDNSLKLTLALPTELGGDGKGNNPEQLLALGYGACFLGALRAVAGQKGVKVPEDVSVKTSVTIGKPTSLPGFGLKVDIRVLGLDGVSDKDGLVAAAHEFCPYSRAFQQGIETSAKAE